MHGHHIGARGDIAAKEGLFTPRRTDYLGARGPRLILHRLLVMKHHFRARTKWNSFDGLTIGGGRHKGARMARQRDVLIEISTRTTITGANGETG